MNERGKWYLVYRDINYDASMLRGEPFVERRVELDSDNRDAAITEAQPRWEDVLGRGVRDFPDYDTRELYRKNFPREPRLRYEEDLSSEFQNPDKL